jgi:hypothetical protein
MRSEPKIVVFTSTHLESPMNNNESGARTRFTVDLSGYPDLVAIYLGLRVNSIRGLLPALEFGPKLKQAVKDNPPGLLRHEFLLDSLYPCI